MIEMLSSLFAVLDFLVITELHSSYLFFPWDWSFASPSHLVCPNPVVSMGS